MLVLQRSRLHPSRTEPGRVAKNLGDLEVDATGRFASLALLGVRARRVWCAHPAGGDCPPASPGHV